MALADFGYEARIDTAHEEQLPVLSLDQSKTRNGYQVAPSIAACGVKARFTRMVLSVVMAGAGLFLMFSGQSILSAGAAGAGLLFPIGAYLVLSALVWLYALTRRPQELRVDQRGRSFHLIKRGLRGEEKSRQTIRFEEVVKITMIDHLASLDMRANAMNWDMGRIDVTWRQNKVTPMIAGDVAELEVLLHRLRREVGMG